MEKPDLNTATVSVTTNATGSCGCSTDNCICFLHTDPVCSVCAGALHHLYTGFALTLR